MSFYLHKLQIRHQSLVTYDEWQGDTKSNKNRLRIENLTQLRKQAYNGSLTEGAKKRLTKAINILVMAARPRKVDNPITGRTHTHRLSYITLTIPDLLPRLTPREGYDKLMQHLLKWLRRNQYVTTYIWKAEYQTRGQLHYHITTPSFIHFQTLRDKWNNLIRSNDLMKDFTKKTGSIDPNSTDIHEVKKIKNLAAYLSKEFCKTIQNPTNTEGKLWDCSNNLSGISYFSLDLQNKHQDNIDKLVKDKKADVYTGDFFSFVKLKSNPALSILSFDERAALNSFLNTIINKKEKS